MLSLVDQSPHRFSYPLLLSFASAFHRRWRIELNLRGNRTVVNGGIPLEALTGRKQGGLEPSFWQSKRKCNQKKRSLWKKVSFRQPLWNDHGRLQADWQCGPVWYLHRLYSTANYGCQSHTRHIGHDEDRQNARPPHQIGFLNRIRNWIPRSASTNRHGRAH